MGLTGAWTYSTSGFISAAFATFPFIIFFFGAKLRAKSPYSDQMHQDAMEKPMARDEEMNMSGTGGHAM